MEENRRKTTGLEGKTVSACVCVRQSESSLLFCNLPVRSLGKWNCNTWLSPSLSINKKGNSPETDWNFLTSPTLFLSISPSPLFSLSSFSITHIHTHTYVFSSFIPHLGFILLMPPPTILSITPLALFRPSCLSLFHLSFLLFFTILCDRPGGLTAIAAENFPSLK